VEHAQKARAPPTCTWPIHERWAMGQGIQRVWFGNGVYYGIPAQTSLGKCPARMSFHPKKVSMGWTT